MNSHSSYSQTPIPPGVLKGHTGGGSSGVSGARGDRNRLAEARAALADAREQREDSQLSLFDDPIPSLTAVEADLREASE